MRRKISNWIAKKIFGLSYWLDNIRGHVVAYGYETAPYCGHHYSGWYGKYNYASYHEGDGIASGHIRFGKLWITVLHYTPCYETDTPYILSINWVKRIEVHHRPHLVGWCLTKRGIKKINPKHYHWLPAWFIYNKPFTKYSDN